MKISLYTDLYMRYGWDEALVEKLIRNYGEEYLRRREKMYDNLEDTLDDSKIVKISGGTLYHITPTITVIRIHPEFLVDMMKFVLELFRDQKAKLAALGEREGVKLSAIWEVLEIETAVKSNRAWHKQLFSVVKNFPDIHKESIPKEAQGESILVGRSKTSSISILFDIYRRVFLNQGDIDTNSLEDGIMYLKTHTYAGK